MPKKEGDEYLEGLRQAIAESRRVSTARVSDREIVVLRKTLDSPQRPEDARRKAEASLARAARVLRQIGSRSG